MAISEFVDGTTPLDASRLNALVGGVNDLTDTGILDKRIVTDSNSGACIQHGIVASNGGTVTFTYTNCMVVFCITSQSNWNAYFIMNAQVVDFSGRSSSDYNCEVSNTSIGTATLTNLNTGTGSRYVAILG